MEQVEQERCWRRSEYCSNPFEGMTEPGEQLYTIFGKVYSLCCPNDTSNELGLASSKEMAHIKNVFFFFLSVPFIALFSILIKGRLT